MKPAREHLVVAALAAVAGVGGATLSHLLREDEAAPVATSAAAAPDGTPSAEVYEVTALPRGLGSMSRARVTVNVVGRTRSPAAELELLRHDPLDGLLHLGRFHLDANGALAVTLPMGQYTAVAHDTGARGALTFEAPGDRPLELFLELEPTRHARLRVVEKGSKRPLAQAVAHLELANDQRGPASAAAPKWVSDGLGRIEVTDLGEEVVTVKVSAPDHLEDEVRVDPSSDVEPEVALAPGSWVSGRVRDENGTALPGITVSSEADTHAVSVDDGSYRLMVPPGHLKLVAVDPAGRSATRIVDVTEATPLAGVDFVLAAPLHLSGTVVDAQSGAPMADVAVQALAAKGAVVARAGTDLLGRFELDGLPEAEVTVVASQGRGARAEAFGVDPRQPEPLILRLQPAAALWGVVTDQNGAPVPGAHVSATWTRGEELGAVTDETGTWRLDDVRPGSAELVARVGATSGSSEVAVFLNPGLALRADLVVELLGTVEGRVVGGKAPPPWQVLAMADGVGRGGHSTVTRSDGTFTLRVAPGGWRFTAMRPRGFTLSREGQITVQAGQTVHVEVPAHDDDDGEGPPEDFSVTPGSLGAAFDGADGHVRFGFLLSAGPAAKAGIQQGDELVAIGGVTVTDTLDAYARAQGTPGSVVELSVKGASGERSLQVRRSGRPTPPP